VDQGQQKAPFIDGESGSKTRRFSVSFRNMKIESKLWVGFGVIHALMIVLAITGIVGMGNMKAKVGVL
jgi:hypothetical protein